MLLSSCATRHFASIKNNTSESIHVQSTFEKEHGTYVLESQIKEGENEIWLYEKSYRDSSKIDKSLTMVEATNSQGCTIIFNRTVIDEKIENHELEVVIEPQDFIDACGEKAAKD